ncbi:MAG: Type 1 glutamine amidotransferase-like domain-containing protein, partial [Rudaea sp.]
MSPSRVAAKDTRGWIVPIGGAEEKAAADASILRRFVDICGGDEAEIVVIPTASQLADTGPRYESIFAELGVARVSSLDFDTRRDTEERNRLRLIEQASGIFFTGGNQLRITTILGGTPAAKLIRQQNARG